MPATQQETLRRFTKESPEQSVVEYLESLPNRTPFVNNYLLFLKTLGVPVMQPLTTCLTIAPDFFDSVIGEICENDCNNHHLAILCTMREPLLRPFFGFVDEYRNGKYFQTHGYSFHLSNDRKYLFDITGEFDQRPHKDAIGRLNSFGKNYFGVEIPFPIINELWSSRSHVYPNLSGHIKKTIFVSEQKTIRFIKQIQRLRKD